jgi:hypothetical protein
VPSDVLRKALDAILKENGVSWPDDDSSLAAAQNPSERDT